MKAVGAHECSFRSVLAASRLALGISLERCARLLGMAGAPCGALTFGAAEEYGVAAGAALEAQRAAARRRAYI